VKFLIDAQLPPALCPLIESKGHEAIHVSGLPHGKTTKDRDINQISMESQSVVVSKDMDFFYSHIASKRPWKLLLVKTGNIRTVNLCELFEQNWHSIEALLIAHTLVQIDRAGVAPVA
jgi:predicted nuclease of predicted toxin-antitoxin system